MNKRVWVVFFLLVGSVALAQLDVNSTVRRLKVRISFSNGVCDSSAHVRLVGVRGPIAERKVDDDCEADFFELPTGTYQVEVSGPNFVDNEHEIKATSDATDFELKVRGPAEQTGVAPGSPLVSAGALNIPAKAIKEFDKSNELMGRQEYPKAIQSLNRAIEIYPSYAAAYNNLGAIYAHLGDRAKEREALEKAVSLDDHLAAAYLNLGRMHIIENDFSAGEDVLNKAVAYNPTDPIGLVLLSYCQFRDQHIDDVITTAHKAHELQGQHSSVHLMAAKSFEQKRDAPNAIAELQLFLKEEPSGQRADLARQELKAVQSIHQ